MINFIATEASGNLRPVSNPMKILFNHMTTVQAVNNPHTFIPPNKFELKDIEQIYGILTSCPVDQTPTYATGIYHVYSYPYLIHTSFLSEMQCIV